MHRTRADWLVGQEPAQFVGQVLGAGVASVRVFLEALQRDRLEIAGDAGVQQPRRDRLGLDHLPQQRRKGLALERRSARQQVKYAGQGSAAWLPTVYHD